MFRAYGLESLAKVLVGFAQQGYGQDESYLRLRETKEYQQRFAGNEERAKKFPHLSRLTEAEYINREQGYEQLMRSYGLPKGFYDNPADYAKLIGANVGSGELQQRLNSYKAVVTDGKATGVLAYARDKYGLSDGDLTALFIDPARAAPLLEKIANASQVGAAAKRVGWGDVSRAESERLAALGINANQAAAGYSQAAELAGLADTIEGTDSTALARADLTRATLEDNADARRRIARRQEERKARFGGGGGFAESKGGIGGLGSANSR